MIMLTKDGDATHMESGTTRPKMNTLGIDLGGTKLAAAVVCDGQLVTEVKKVPTPKGADKIVESLLGLIADFQKDHLIAGVGIATAGVVNVETGEVIGSTGNLPGWTGTQLKKLVEQKTMLPTHAENDANAAAYAEVHAAGLGDKECVVTITLGTGIGGGLVMNGKLYRGQHWAGGEVGHLKISMDNKRLCTCGRWDCWEAYGSGSGFLRTSKEIIATIKPEQSDLAGKLPELTNEMVGAAADKGDPVAHKIIDIWHEHVATGLVSLAHALDPYCFFITGGMEKFVKFEMLRELFIDGSLPMIGQNVKILPATLGTSAGMIGAASLVVDNMVVR